MVGALRADSLQSIWSCQLRLVRILWSNDSDLNTCNLSRARVKYKKRSREDAQVRRREESGGGRHHRCFLFNGLQYGVQVFNLLSCKSRDNSSSRCRLVGRRRGGWRCAELNLISANVPFYYLRCRPEVQAHIYLFIYLKWTVHINVCKVYGNMPELAIGYFPSAVSGRSVEITIQ